MKKILTFIASVTVSAAVFAGGKGGETVNLPYFMPSTVLHIEVEAEIETYHAGPYAKYAQKYLGVNVPQKTVSRCRVIGVNVTSGIEADRSARYQISLEGIAEIDRFLKFSEDGIVSLWGECKGASAESTPSELAAANTDWPVADVAVKATLPQSVLKARTEEQKAYELASAIFALRTTRMNIITGNTDATYSGSAMGAAFDEIGRLENGYISMFKGYSSKSSQKMSFDIVPERGDTLFTAFRISDSDGLLPADSGAGRIVKLEIVPQEVEQGHKTVISKNDKNEYVFYRIPAVCTVVLTDGNTLLFNGRQTIYQLGTQAAMPVPKPKK